jgi:glycosyltransferase involved in cell wall biosynthesis
MKNNKEKFINIKRVSLCMIVKPNNNKDVLLSRCLNNISLVVNEICITITGKEGQDKKLEDVCKQYNAKISYFEWKNDFASARNFNFSQATSDYIFWLDADDMVKGLEYWDEMFDNVVKNNLDAVVMDYLYDFNEYRICIVKHLRTRLIKNDNCVKWVGKVHEDLIENRKLVAYQSKDIQVLHLTNNDRAENAKVRNLEIALEMLDSDNQDPRNFWLVANAYHGMSKDLQAIDYFKQFIKRSKSEIEILHARCRMASCFINIGDLNSAISEQLEVIKMKPWFPDGYLGLGEIYLKQKKYKHAKEFLIQGLSKDIPDKEYIVWNPRDYDYNPYRLLAEIYFQLGKVKEAKQCIDSCLDIYPTNPDLISLSKQLDFEINNLDKIDDFFKKWEKSNDTNKFLKALEVLPIELRSHPKIVFLKNNKIIKTESSGRDLVIYCSFTEEEWTPNTAIEKGIGGSEEHTINLAKRLVKLGWNVTVYNNCGHKEQIFDGVVYKPFWEWNYRDKQDVVILWRHPMAADYEINAKKIILDLHDVVAVGEFTEKRVNRIDTIVCKSEWQRGLFPNIPDNKFVILNNCFDLSEFNNPCIIRNKKKIIYTSSPDRGLSALLDIFEKVKERIPNVELEARYGWRLFDVFNEGQEREMKWKDNIVEKLKKHNVEYTRLPHQEIAKKYQEAALWVYPSEFGEINCITAQKAQAAGAIPVTTNFAAMNEMVKFGRKIHSSKSYDDWALPNQFDFSVSDEAIKTKFVDEIVNLLSNEEEQEKIRKEMREYALTNWNGDVTAQKWNELICR